MTEAFKPSWAEQLQQALRREVTPERAAMRRLGDAARALIERMFATSVPLPAVEEAIESLEAVHRRLDAYPAGRIPEGFSEASTSGDPHAFFDNSPLMGRANPLAAPITTAVEGNRVVGQVRFGAAYEGAPGCVHGGFVAAAFDEVLGLAQSLGGSPGMTGTLTIRYRKPTPLHTDLRFVARLDRQDGRKIYCSGELYAGELLCAEAEGIFISVDFSKIAELMARRQADAD